MPLEEAAHADTSRRQAAGKSQDEPKALGDHGVNPQTGAEEAGACGVEADEASTCAGSSVSSTPRRPTGGYEHLAAREHEASHLDAQVSREVLVAALAVVLTNIAGLGRQDAMDTRFHGVRPPPMSVYDYLKRISQYFDCSDETLLVSLVYIDRVLKLRPEFAVNFASVHRVILASITLAAKFVDDQFYSCRHYARVGGVKPKHLTALETMFLELVSWQLFVTAEEYEEYRQRLLVVAEACVASLMIIQAPVSPRWRADAPPLAVGRTIAHVAECRPGSDDCA